MSKTEQPLAPEIIKAMKELDNQIQKIIKRGRAGLATWSHKKHGFFLSGYVPLKGVVTEVEASQLQAWIHAAAQEVLKERVPEWYEELKEKRGTNDE